MAILWKKHTVHIRSSSIPCSKESLIKSGTWSEHHSWVFQYFWIMLLLVWRRKLWGFGGRPQDADILPASQIENSGGEMIKRLIHWLILWWARWSFVVSLDHVHYVLRCLIYRLDLCTDRNVQRGVGYSHAWIPCYTLLICNDINIQPWMSYVSTKCIDPENNLVLDTGILN